MLWKKKRETKTRPGHHDDVTKGLLLLSLFEWKGQDGGAGMWDESGWSLITFDVNLAPHSSPMENEAKKQHTNRK